MEAPPAKNFVFLVTFLGILALLYSLIPASFYASAEYGGITVPDERFEAIDILSYATTYTMNLTDEAFPHWYFSDDWGIDEGFGYNFYFVAEGFEDDYALMINYHYWPFLIFKTGQHAQTWYDSQGMVVSEKGMLYDDTIDQYAEDYEDMKIAEFRVKCKHLQMMAWIGYNGTEYSNCLDAWMDDTLAVKWAITWDEMGTGMNSWNLIGMLLFFQIPSEFPSPFGIILAMPIWALEAILIFQIILAIVKSLPFT